jgi:hypothetical protein
LKNSKKLSLSPFMLVLKNFRKMRIKDNFWKLFNTSLPLPQTPTNFMSLLRTVVLFPTVGFFSLKQRKFPTFFKFSFFITHSPFLSSQTYYQSIVIDKLPFKSILTNNAEPTPYMTGGIEQGSKLAPFSDIRKLFSFDKTMCPNTKCQISTNHCIYQKNYWQGSFLPFISDEKKILMTVIFLIWKMWFRKWNRNGKECLCRF